MLTPLISPHPSPLPVRRGEGEGSSHSLSFLNSSAVGPRGNGMTEPAGVVLDLQASYRGVAGSMNTPESVALKPAFFVSFTLTGPVTLKDR